MCYNSYDRLIDLAKRTGDRLIVHDPIEGRDVVIMGVDEYEKIIDNNEGFDYNSDFDCDDCDDFDNPFDPREYRDVRGLSSDQMLDQINRDIAIWRAEKEDEEEWERDMALENELEDEVPFDPFAEQDYHPASWHSAGSVLGNRYTGLDNDEFVPPTDNIPAESGIDEDTFETEDEDEDFDFNMDDWNREVANDFNSGLAEEKKSDNEIKIEDIPFDIDFTKIENPRKDIPFLNQDLEGEDWDEEPLDSDDDPVFYEEPV